jgi:hypothetical protein
MLTFNTLLKLYGFDPKHVRLLRHAENRRRSDGTSVQSNVIAAWRNDFAAFELYSRLHDRAIYGPKKLGAIFLAMPGGQTVFAGIWKIIGEGRNTRRLRCNITERDDADLFLYRIKKLDGLAEYERRLVINWGVATRAWSQNASSQNKKIMAIADEPDPAFPGWASFVAPIRDVPALPASWQAILSNARGVYLLVNRKTGQQYVGCALGVGGFLTRWMSYAVTGHGGNVQLKGIAPENFDVSVLEAVASTANDTDVIRAEVAWKRKLGTRVHGLNSN